MRRRRADSETKRVATTVTKAGGKQRSALSQQVIVKVALRLVRRHGAAKLSMRALAAELGVTPMAIYYHVPDKDSLFELLLHAVLAEVPMPTPTGIDWPSELKSYLVEPWLRLTAYPGLAAALLERSRPRSDREFLRHGVSILRAAGFEQRVATLSIVSFHTYMFGVLSMQVQLGKLVQRPVKGGKAKSPVTRAPKINFREIVDFGVNTMIEGLRARQRGARRPVPAPARPAGKHARARPTHK